MIERRPSTRIRVRGIHTPAEVTWLSIRPKNKNSWQIRIFRGAGPDGKKRYDTYTISGSRKDAEAFERKKLVELDEGSYVTPTKLTFQQHAEDWLREHVAFLRESTAASYECLLRKHAFPVIGKTQLEKLTPQDLQKTYARMREKKLSSRRIKYLHAVIRGCLQYAVKMKLLPYNMAKGYPFPKSDREKEERHYLTLEQAKLLQNAVEGHFLEIVVTLALWTGMRRGEILALQWSDVNLDSKVITVRRSIVELTGPLKFGLTKTGVGRSIDLPDYLISVLRTHKAHQNAQRLKLGPAYGNLGLVCSHDDGTPWRPSTITNAFKNVVRKIGLPFVSFHDLRHTHASILLAEGIHPKVVQERLGHSTIKLTMDTYSHVMPTLQREAADRLNCTLAPNRQLSRP